MITHAFNALFMLSIAKSLHTIGTISTHKDTSCSPIEMIENEQ